MCLGCVHVRVFYVRVCVCVCVNVSWMCLILCVLDFDYLQMPDASSYIYRHRRRAENTKSKFIRRSDAMNFKYIWFVHVTFKQWNINGFIRIYMYHVWLIERSRNPWIFDSSLLDGVWEFGCCRAFSYRSPPFHILYLYLICCYTLLLCIEYNLTTNDGTATRITEYIRNSLSTHCGRHSNEIEQIQQRTRVHYLLCLAWPKKSGITESMHAWPLLSHSPYTSLTFAVGVRVRVYSFPCGAHFVPVNQPNNVIYGRKIKRYNLLLCEEYLV